MDGGAYWATAHGVAESDTTDWLHFHFQEDRRIEHVAFNLGNPMIITNFIYFKIISLWKIKFWVFENNLS